MRCCVGHSHQPKMFVEGEDWVLDITSLESVRKSSKQVVNVGSVGQPRDKDERACYVVYRRAEQDVWWRRIPYDIPLAQKRVVCFANPLVANSRAFSLAVLAALAVSRL